MRTRLRWGEFLCFEATSVASSSVLFLPSVGHLPGGRVPLRSAGRGPGYSRSEGLVAELGRRPADRKGDCPPAATAGSEDIARRRRAENKLRPPGISEEVDMKPVAEAEAVVEA